MIFALGATLYHLITGSEPPSAQEVFLRRDALIPPRQVNPAISPSVEGAVLAAMSPHPGDRPPTVDVFRQLLRSQPVDRMPAPPQPKPVRAARGDVWLLVLGVLLSALVLYLNLR